MAWGSQGSSDTIEGASGRTWTLRFERRLAPREDSKTANLASSVWLVRDEKSARLYAAKRQTLSSASEVDLLVDEAAAWRAACLADTDKHVIELVDVFVSRDSPYSVTFLAEFCSRGLLPKRQNLSEPVLLTLVADLAGAAASIQSPHAHISYESLLVDETGRIRLAGFGAHRSAILRDNPGLTPNDDAFDIGLLIYELMFGAPPPESFQIPESSYSPQITDIIVQAFAHPHPSDLRNFALAAGAEPHAPVVDIEQPDTAAIPVAEHVARATDRNVDRLATGVDIAAAFASLLKDLIADPDPVAQEIFSSLFKKPLSKDPLFAMRTLTMLHNIALDGPDSVTAAIRKNDKFIGWVESSWTRESIESSDGDEEQHSATPCFTGGELAFYAAFLRRKSRFHMLAAGGFSGRWDRTGTPSADGRDVLVARRRKVISGMADVIEMASELGCQLAAASDEEAAVKQTALGALVSECSLAFNAGLELSREVLTVREAEKLTLGIRRLYDAARKLIFAVENVPSAGGEQWVEQFGSETPPDVAAEVSARELEAHEDASRKEFPEDGWAQATQLVDKERVKKPKKDKPKKKKEKKRTEAPTKTENDAEKEEDEITVEDGALVVHGTNDGASAVATMFGDLLKINDQVATGEPAQEQVPQGLPDMSNAQALASAFGVPEEAVGATYAALPPPEGFGDEYDGEGGYEDFRARQEQHETERSRVLGESNTAAWAAQAGYSSQAVVVSDNKSGMKKSHPAICQCAICEQEEQQDLAQQQDGKSKYGNGASNFANRLDEQPEGEQVYDYQVNQGSTGYSAMNNFQKHQDREDSLDDDNGEYSEPPRDEGARASYYDDDYDSYESISYKVEPERTSNPQQGIGTSKGTVREEGSPFSVSKELSLNMKKLRVGDKIADTPLIYVSKGEYNREVVAIKRLSKSGMKSQIVIQEFINEVEVMCSLSHGNILNCKAASLKKPNYVFVTDLMKRGTLFDVLHKSKIKLNWALIRKIALQLAEGMSHMHEKGVIHRDLKSLNIFADGGYNIKIGDFGLSCHVNSPQGTGISGTYQYMAPEVLRGETHTFQSDVFSYGHVLCEMITGIPPFHGIDSRQVAERVVNEDLRPPIPPTCQRAYAKLIQMCWGSAPSTRPSFQEIIHIISTTTK